MEIQNSPFGFAWIKKEFSGDNQSLIRDISVIPFEGQSTAGQPHARLWGLKIPSTANSSLVFTCFGVDTPPCRPRLFLTAQRPGSAADQRKGYGVYDGGSRGRTVKVGLYFDEPDLKRKACCERLSFLFMKEGPLEIRQSIAQTPMVTAETRT
ncbi:MAG: hypothetical protein OXH63_23230 [Gemmatimonadetes bacterium]|nr:hypothetical protein [Gemmatimonadota bacterium]